MLIDIEAVPGRALLLGLLLLLGAALAAALRLQARDRVHARAVREALLAARDPAPPRWNPAMADGLPEVAQRYLRRAIAPGTPLGRVVCLEMEGEFVLGSRTLPMRVRQVLAPPARGFVWEAEIGSGWLRLNGSDGLHRPAGGGCDSWTCFWLHGLAPLARVGGNTDHARAAATRAMLESVWVPASLLPQYGARWVATGPDSAVVHFAEAADIEPMHLRLNADGTLAEVSALRWSDANPDKVYRLQPFGGRMLESADIGGFTLPVRVELGNQFGTPGQAPFFRARLMSVSFGGQAPGDLGPR